MRVNREAPNQKIFPIWLQSRWLLEFDGISSSVSFLISIAATKFLQLTRAHEHVIIVGRRHEESVEATKSPEKSGSPCPVSWYSVNKAMQRRVCETRQSTSVVHVK